MKYPTEKDVKKLGPITRGLAALILICSIIAAVVLGIAAFTEPFRPLLIFGFVTVALMAHVSGSVVLKGYAPKYLLFTHGPK